MALEVRPFGTVGLIPDFTGSFPKGSQVLLWLRVLGLGV